MPLYVCISEWQKKEGDIIAFYHFRWYVRDLDQNRTIQKVKTPSQESRVCGRLRVAVWLESGSPGGS